MMFCLDLSIASIQTSPDTHFCLIHDVNINTHSHRNSPPV